MTGALSRQERESLLEGLISPSEEVRRLAVEQALRLPVEEAVVLLVERLGDASWRVRKAAIDRMVACREDAVVLPALAAALADDENAGRRNAAFEALVALGPRAVATLVEAASSEDVDVRKLAIDALAAIGDERTRTVFVSALGDADANVRAAAADALGRVGGVAEIAELVRVGTASTEAPLVRLSALRSLDGLRASVGLERLADALSHPQLCSAALELLGHSTDPAALGELEKAVSSGVRTVRESAIRALLQQLGHRDGLDGDRLVDRLRAMARADGQLVERCCEGLSGVDGFRLATLVQFLGLVADARAVLPLLRAGRDEALQSLVDETLVDLGAVTVTALTSVWGELAVDLEIRACRILGRIGGDQAEAVLVRTLQGDGPSAVESAAQALGEGGAFGRMTDLVRRLERASLDVEAEHIDLVDRLIDAIARLAARAELADPDVHVQLVEVLVSRLGGASTPLRVAIARVLAQIGRPDDGDVIEYLVKDASPLVRRAAVHALARLPDGRARSAARLALGDEASGVRIAAAGVMGGSDAREALDDLARLACDGDARVAAAAVRAAGAVLERRGRGLDESEAWIARALGREPTVALAALETLMRVGGPAAAAAAAGAIARPEAELVRSAAACLARHASSDALAALVPLVAHEDWAVRAEAVRALAARRHRSALPAMLRRLEVEHDDFVRDALLAATRRLEE
ncbi:MAG: HEAT repeat domain-containing protein [Myxococcota bacterium]